MNTKLFWASTFCILWLLDTVFTTMFIMQFGIDTEANPIMRYVMEHSGIAGFVGIKCFLWAFLTIWYKKTQTWKYIALTIVMVPVVCMGAIVGLNLLNAIP